MAAWRGSRHFALLGPRRLDRGFSDGARAFEAETLNAALWMLGGNDHRPEWRPTFLTDTSGRRRFNRLTGYGRSPTVFRGVLLVIPQPDRRVRQIRPVQRSGACAFPSSQARRSLDARRFLFGSCEEDSRAVVVTDIVLTVERRDCDLEKIRAVLSREPRRSNQPHDLGVACGVRAHLLVGGALRRAARISDCG
jgi:hypothetical protein